MTASSLCCIERQLFHLLMLLDLSGQRRRGGVPLSRGPGLPLTGSVGRALSRRGLRVHLAEAGRGEDLSELCAEIMVINPARPDRGSARVADDGMIRWECRLSDPAVSTQGIGPSEIAGTIARALNRPQGSK